MPIDMTDATMNDRDVSFVVQLQVDAYNRRDLEGFLATYAQDVRLYEYPDKLLLSGIDAMRLSYERLFASATDLLGTVDNRIVLGDFVIDHETISGASEQPVSATAIYHVRDGLIHSVRFIYRTTGRDAQDAIAAVTASA